MRLAIGFLIVCCLGLGVRGAIVLSSLAATAVRTGEPKADGLGLSDRSAASTLSYVARLAQTAKTANIGGKGCDFRSVL